MTWDRKQKFERRLEKLALVFTAKPMPTRDEAIRRAAYNQLSGEQLDALRDMIKAGRSNLPSNEREAEALAAYRLAMENAIGLIKP